MVRLTSEPSAASVGLPGPTSNWATLRMPQPIATIRKNLVPAAPPDRGRAAQATQTPPRTATKAIVRHGREAAIGRLLASCELAITGGPP